jgi:hypothetical protein
MGKTELTRLSPLNPRPGLCHSRPTELVTHELPVFVVGNTVEVVQNFTILFWLSLWWRFYVTRVMATVCISL